MKTQIDLSKKPYECCPSFEVCSTNACPPHPDYLRTLKDLPEDKLIPGWRKCRATKPTRLKIGRAFKLKSLGLTLRELSGMRQSIRLKNQSFSTREKIIETPISSTQNPSHTPTSDIQLKRDLTESNGT